MGLGRFGGGLGATRWLLRQGAASVTVSDRADADALAGPLAVLEPQIASGQVRLELGGHQPGTFTAADLVVVNPGVPRPWDDPILRAAADAGVTLTTEIELAARRLDRRQVVAITGTAGKSTTASLTAHLLRASGRRAHLGGNIGGSMLEMLDAIEPGDDVVLELSSFQLFWLGDERPGAMPGDGWSPHVAAWTNLTPNHLDWHETLEHYRRSKETIHRFQRAVDGDVLIRGADVPALPADAPLDLPGEHNRRNAALAVAIAAAVTGEPAADIVPRLAGAVALPDRLQVVRRIDRPAGPVLFVNDSKCTTPEGVRLAVDALAADAGGRAHVHLIAGGYDKGSAIDAIVELAPSLGGFYTIGAIGRRLADGALEAGAVADRVVHADTVDAAVDAAWTRLRAAPRGLLLLSPGCASWDQFTEYRERGRRFTERGAGLRD
jgi:UDP-N-acetylmuramoylalanine--D-glutamate ligase